MYFYIFEGKLYWGRHQNLPPHRNVHTWIFRNKPVKTCHMYMTGQDSFIVRHAESKLGEASFNILISSPENFGNKIFTEVTIYEGYCYHLNTHGWSIVASTDKNDINRTEFKNMFRNRLKEYRGRYFLPIDKHSRYV